MIVPSCICPFLVLAWFGPGPQFGAFLLRFDFLSVWREVKEEEGRIVGKTLNRDKGEGGKNHVCPGTHRLQILRLSFR